MRKIAALLVAVALLAGCDDDPQPGVTYQTPPAPQAQESAQADARRWRLANGRR